jgi:hypothetical protein
VDDVVCFICAVGVTFVTSALVGQHQQVALVSKSRLMLPAQQITVVTNGVGGEVAREGEQKFTYNFILIDKCSIMSVEGFLDILCMSVDRHMN